ncbi:MAG: hypothetical protein ACOCT8_01865 [Actinomycetota bacterium]
MSDIRDLLHQADGGPADRPDLPSIRRRGRRLRASRIGGLTAGVLAVVAIAGGVALQLVDGQTPAPPVVEQPEQGIEATAALEVAPVVEGSWPEGGAQRDESALEISDDELIGRLVATLQDAPTAAPDELDREVAEPGYEVVFLDDQDRVLERLGYYTHVELWGEHEGRWIDGWQPLAVTIELPVEDLADREDPDVVAGDDSWMDEEAMQADQAERGEGTWVVGYFCGTDEDAAGPDFDERLLKRWKRISDEELDLDREEQLRQALAALAGPPPTHLSNTWDQDHELALATAGTDGTELVLDFDRLDAGANGTTHAMAMQAQFETIAFHYYPEAETICVLDDGEPAAWLHDMEGCPSRDLPQ